MDDNEIIIPKAEYSPSGYGSGELGHYDTEIHRRRPLRSRFIDSFRRDPNAHATPKGSLGGDGKVFDVEGAAQATATSPLQRHLKGRHLQMIAIGGSIGTGLFVGSGNALATGGPASLVISFILTGSMLSIHRSCMVLCIGLELRYAMARGSTLRDRVRQLDHRVLEPWFYQQ